MAFYAVGDYVVNSTDVRYVAPVKHYTEIGKYNNIIEIPRCFFDIAFISGGHITLSFDHYAEAEKERNLFCRNIGTTR